LQHGSPNADIWTDGFATPLAELRRCAGRQFDPRCVELLALALVDPSVSRAGSPADASSSLARTQNMMRASGT
jgi:hypothetical protein